MQRRGAPRGTLTCDVIIDDIVLYDVLIGWSSLFSLFFLWQSTFRMILWVLFVSSLIMTSSWLWRPFVTPSSRTWFFMTSLLASLCFLCFFFFDNRRFAGFCGSFFVFQVWLWRVGSCRVSRGPGDVMRVMEDTVDGGVHFSPPRHSGAASATLIERPLAAKKKCNNHSASPSISTWGWRRSSVF